MTYYNRDNLFNLPPIPKGQQGNQGATGAKGDEWTFGSSKDWLPGDVGYTNLIDISGITNVSQGITTSAFRGGVLAPNGKIYCIPDTFPGVLIIDPLGNTIDYNSINGLTTSSKYFGGVLAPNGNIYCAPYSTNNSMVINTNNNTISYINNLLSGYNGAVLANNGLIYFIPYNATSVLVINPNNNTGFTNIQGLTGLGSHTKYTGGVLAPNGKIYCMPGFTNNIMIIDPIGNTVDTNSIILSQSDYYWGGCLGVDGNIYSFPTFTNNQVLKINTTDNTISYISIPTSVKIGWIGCVSAMNGNIYSIPFDWNQNNSLVLDPSLNSIINIVTNIGLNASPFDPINDPYRKCIGGVLATNGNIYGIPYRLNFIPIIKTGLPKYPNWMLDPYFNKF